MTSASDGPEPTLLNEGPGRGHDVDRQLAESYQRRRLVVQKLMSLDQHELHRERSLHRIVLFTSVLSVSIVASLTAFAFTAGLLRDETPAQYIALLSLLVLIAAFAATLMQLTRATRASRSTYETAAATFQEELTQAWDDLDAARVELVHGSGRARSSKEAKPERVEPR